MSNESIPATVNMEMVMDKMDRLRNERDALKEEVERYERVYGQSDFGTLLAERDALKEENERLTKVLGTTAKVAVKSLALLRRLDARDSASDDFDTGDCGGVEGTSDAFQAEIDAFFRELADGE